MLQTFEVRDLKHLLEENGHETLPFISDWIDKFESHPAAWKLIVEQVEENEDEKKDLEKRLENL